jgi:hypothetical protein
LHSHTLFIRHRHGTTRSSISTQVIARYRPCDDERRCSCHLLQLCQNVSQTAVKSMKYQYSLPAEQHGWASSRIFPRAQFFNLSAGRLGPVGFCLRFPAMPHETGAGRYLLIPFMTLFHALLPYCRLLLLCSLAPFSSTASVISAEGTN